MFEDFDDKKNTLSEKTPVATGWEQPSVKNNILAPPPPAIIDTPASSDVGKKERWTIYVIVAIFFLVLLGAGFLGAWYYIKPESFPIKFNHEADNVIPLQVLCKNDSKLCPDGSIVKRVSPGCNFAVCPTGKANICLREGEIIVLQRSKEDEVRCCQGLRIIAGEEEGLGFCAKCGDNKCVLPEDSFNCPEDCQNEIKNIDSDNDGLTDQEEGKYGTDPNNSDSDGDGYMDGEEVKAGYNPLGAGLLP